MMPAAMYKALAESVPPLLREDGAGRLGVKGRIRIAMEQRLGRPRKTAACARWSAPGTFWQRHRQLAGPGHRQRTWRAAASPGPAAGHRHPGPICPTWPGTFAEGVPSSATGSMRLRGCPFAGHGYRPAGVDALASLARNKAGCHRRRRCCASAPCPGAAAPLATCSSPRWRPWPDAPSGAPHRLDNRAPVRPDRREPRPALTTPCARSPTIWALGRSRRPPPPPSDIARTKRRDHLTLPLPRPLPTCHSMRSSPPVAAVAGAAGCCRAHQPGRAAGRKRLLGTRSVWMKPAQIPARAGAANHHHRLGAFGPSWTAPPPACHAARPVAAVAGRGVV